MEENKENQEKEESPQPSQPEEKESESKESEQKFSYQPVEVPREVKKSSQDGKIKILMILVIFTLAISVINMFGTANIYGTLEGMITGGTEQGAQPPEQPEKTTQPVGLKGTENPVLGSADAPVTMIEYSDFECPFCARFGRATHQQLVDEYVKTGKVKIEFRNLPLSFHQHAQKAAEAGECAHEQGKFWDFYNKVFKEQISLDIESLKQAAVDLGLDTESFNECLDSGEMASKVNKDKQDATNDGIRGTPGFIINGELVSGAQPFENFKEIIDRALENA